MARMETNGVSMQSVPADGRARVLVASSDAAYATNLIRYLEIEGYALERCHDARGVLRLAGRRDFDVIILDLALCNEGDVELVSYVRRRSPGTQLILIFDGDQIERAIAGLRNGAFFYLPRTTQPPDVGLVVQKALRSIETRRRVEVFEWAAFEELLGNTEAMRRVLEIVRKVAPTDSTVLLLGESGTGKDLFANTIHRLSPRRDMPFIAINCAALPENLLESELFGHVKGAFTGAGADKPGLFEEGDGGTVFLDEIGDMAPLTQAKLLRVLQNGEVRRVGASTTHHVDVRIIAATNRDLEEAVAEKNFREDLYFRLNVIQIRIPPLRDREDALPKLVAHFVNAYNAKFGRNVRDIDPHAQALLSSYPYPGNVRELESIIAHAVIMSEDGVIRARDLPDQVRAGLPRQRALPYDADSAEIPSLSEMEERLIRRALERLDGNQTEVARKLGVSRSTLWRKMKQYGIPANG